MIPFLNFIATMLITIGVIATMLITIGVIGIVAACLAAGFYAVTRKD